MPVSEPQMPQPQRVGNDGYGTECHRRAGNHRTKKQAQYGIQEPRCDGHPKDIVEKRKEQVLADIAHGALAQAPRPDNPSEIALH